MAGIQGHRHIGDKAVNGLVAAVGDTCAPVIFRQPVLQRTNRVGVDEFNDTTSLISSFGSNEGFRKGYRIIDDSNHAWNFCKW
jgi:hypothetical protein